MLPVPALCTHGAAVPVAPVKLTDVGDASARGAAQCTVHTKHSSTNTTGQPFGQAGSGRYLLNATKTKATPGPLT